METVLLEVRDRVATITLNRPEVLNAIDPPLIAGLAGALERCRADDVGAVVLTGAGRGFCAGGDVRAMLQLFATGGDVTALFEEVMVHLHATVMALKTLPRPVIAAINGPAGGAGISLAAACDLRVAAASVTFKPAYTALGLTPDGGWTALVPPLVGVGRATEMLFLDRPIEAAAAHAAGLVNEVVPDERLGARVAELAAALAATPTGALAGAKALLNTSLLAGLQAQLDQERERVVARTRTEEFRTRVMAFLAKGKR